MAGTGEALGGLTGAIGGIAGLLTAPDNGDKFRKAAIDVFKKLKVSNFDFRALSPPELQILAQYSPETYQAVVPPEVRQAQDSAQGRQAQLGGIGYLQDVRDKGLPVESRLAAEEAQRNVANEFQGGQDAILEDLAMRGRLGGGSEIQARLGGNQRAMELAGGMGNELARAEIDRRLQAAQGAAGLGAQERGQTQGFNLSNADSANRANQWFTNTLNEAAMRNAQARQAASFNNTENRQRIGETNESNRYNVDLANLNRQNDLRAQQFGQEYQRAAGLAGQYDTMAGARDAQRAAHIGTYQSIGQGIGLGTGGVLDYYGVGIPSGGANGGTAQDQQQRKRSG